MARRLSDYAVFTSAAMRAIGPRTLAEGRAAMRHVAALWRRRRSNPFPQDLGQLENPSVPFRIANGQCSLCGAFVGFGQSARAHAQRPFHRMAARAARAAKPHQGALFNPKQRKGHNWQPSNGRESWCTRCGVAIATEDLRRFLESGELPRGAHMPACLTAQNPRRQRRRRCYACQREIRPGDPYWLASNGSGPALCSACADEIAARDDPPMLRRIPPLFSRTQFNPQRKKKKPTGGDWQPDMFGGAGVQRREGMTKAAELELAREEMRDSGARDLFDAERNPRPWGTGKRWCPSCRMANQTVTCANCGGPTITLKRNPQRTPGFNTRIGVAFTSDKHGRPIAYYLSRGGVSWRWIRIGYDQAKLWVAQDQADQIPYRPNFRMNPDPEAEARYERAIGHGERPSTARRAAANPGTASGRRAPNCPSCGDLVRLPNPTPPHVTCSSCGQVSAVRRP